MQNDIYACMQASMHAIVVCVHIRVRAWHRHLLSQSKATVTWTVGPSLPLHAVTSHTHPRRHFTLSLTASRAHSQRINCNCNIWRHYPDHHTTTRCPANRAPAVEYAPPQQVQSHHPPQGASLERTVARPPPHTRVRALTTRAAEPKGNQPTSRLHATSRSPLQPAQQTQMQTVRLSMPPP